MKSKQSGLTAIQIAITMAIISLLFTLTVKGRELIENSRAESLAHELRNIQTALHNSQDRVRALHGDGSKPPERLNGSPGDAHHDNGDLRLDDQLNFVLSESHSIWRHVKRTGFTQSATDSTAKGYVPISGSLGANDISVAPISGMSADYIICSDNIPGRLVRQLDMMMDDGNTATGSMLIGRGTNGGEPIPSSSISDSDSYLACLAA